MENKFLMKTIFTFLSLSFLMFGQSGKDVSKVGTTAATFLEIGAGAAANGMGAAFVSRANDASALYWNVAGTAGLNQNEVIAIHTNWIADISFDYAGLVLALGDFGNLGFSFTSLSMPDDKVRTVAQPEGTGEYFSAGDLAVGISYSRKLTRSGKCPQRERDDLPAPVEKCAGNSGSPGLLAPTEPVDRENRGACAPINSGAQTCKKGRPHGSLGSKKPGPVPLRIRLAEQCMQLR